MFQMFQRFKLIYIYNFFFSVIPEFIRQKKKILILAYSIMTDSPCAMWDFRVSAETLTYTDIIDGLKIVAKQFVFQLEEGDSGYIHYQGRLSLIKKRRSAEKHIILNLFPKWKPNYLAVTVNSNFYKGDMFYVMKEDTRKDGPWSDKDIPKEKYIPRHFRNRMDKLLPFQQHIWDTATVFDDRIINMIYDKGGNNGKSTIASLCELFGKGIDLPPVNDAEKLVASCCDICEGKNVRDPSPIFVDMPRAMNKERLNGIYTAIEQIKKGKLYDLRYKYKEWWIDSPQIWVFSNIEPDENLLSKDRWRVWVINENKELEKYDDTTIY